MIGLKKIFKKSLSMILAILIAIMIMPNIDLKVKAAGSITVDLPTKTATGSCAANEELKLYIYQLFGLTSDVYDSHDGFTYGFTQPVNENGKIYSDISIGELAADGVYSSYMTYDDTDYMTFKASENGTYTFHAECLDTYDLSTFNTCDITITIGASTTKYTVTFDSNSGSSVSDITDITSGSKISEPPVPTRNGYSFDGWYKDDFTFLDEWDFANDTVTANTALHAKWTDNTAPTVVSISRADISPTKATSIRYTVTFSEDVTGVDTYDFNSIASGVSHTLWTVTGSGKTYTVTINGISGSGTFQLFSAEIGTGIKDLAGNDVIGAYTGEIYTIDTIPPLITGVENNQKYTSEVTLACSESGISVSLLKDGSTVSGYNFEKISTNGDYTLSVTDSVGNISTINFTVDIPETYTVSFNTNGGSTNPEIQTITENGYVIAPSNPTKTGCDFLGWYNGSTKWNFATDNVTGNMTLTAHWQNAQYTVSFNTDGGSTAPENQTIDYNNYVSAPTNPTKTGYDFLGWYNGSTKWNFATDKVTSNVTLTAHWKIQKTITIIEAPDEIKNPDLISVTPQGEAFDNPVEVRMKNDPAVQQAITNAIKDKVTSDIKDITVFPLDISLYIKGTDTKVQPNSGTSVIITCPIPENLLANKNKIKVVCLIGGKLTLLDTKIVLVNGVYCAQFTATHFSPYAMVVDKANELSNTTNPKTSENNTVWTFSVISILSVITFTIARKKRKFKIIK